ncbi:MAG: Dihydrolipoyl dehydrogenase [candidate division WS2 bacterium]|nr:Dihydrolipoyl dehydrogenase [Candidatus Psychracetigena formicireducens]
MQILGNEAPNLISEGSVIVSEGLTLDKLSEIIHPHPTLGEIYFEAAEAGRGLGLHTLGSGLHYSLNNRGLGLRVP